MRNNEYFDHTEELGGSGPDVSGYVRVSGSGQKKHGFSTAAQVKQIRELAVKTNASRIHWFFDLGKTATTMDHRKISQIITLKEEDKSNFLLVVSVDRISRECAEATDFFLRFVNRGGTIRTPKEEFVPHDLTSLLLFIIKSYQAEVDDTQRSEKANLGKIEAFLSGFWVVGHIPFGYIKLTKIRNGKEKYWLQKDGNSEEVVKFVYQEFRKTGSLVSVQKSLRDDPRFKLFLPTGRIQGILRDPVYKGAPTFQGNVVHDESLPYVEDSLFEAVQPILAQSYQKHKSKSKESEMVEKLFYEDPFKSMHELVTKWNEHNSQFPGHRLQIRDRRSDTQIAFGCSEPGHRPIQWRFPHKIKEKIYLKTTMSPLSEFLGIPKIGAKFPGKTVRKLISVSLLPSEGLDFYGEKWLC